jgi:prepilin-type N-terminal cleavage/methylation domain-containing protein
LAIGIQGIELIAKKRVKSIQAFSLVEILLVLALLSVLAGVVAGNLGAFIKGANFEPPHRVLKKAVLDAVYYSSERKRATYLSYFEENATFLVSDSMGVPLAEHRVYKDLSDDTIRNASNIPKVSFHAVGPLSGVEGDGTNYDEDELVLPRVVFHSGSSVPFRVNLEFGEKDTEMFFDPFSGYILKKEE